MSILPHNEDNGFLPPHEAKPVPGFHAYSNQLVLSPGGTLDLRLSGEGAVTGTIRRLGTTTDDATVLASLPTMQATTQAVRRGCYVYVENPSIAGTSVAVSVWFRPLRLTKENGLFSQRDFELLLEGNLVVCRFRHGGRTHRLQGPAVALKKWHHAVVCWRQQKAELYLNGTLCAAARLPQAATSWPGRGPLRIGALANRRGETTALFTGDIWAPAAHTIPLPSVVRGWYACKTAPEPARCSGHWKFDAVDGAAYRDASPSARHGRPVNYPIRMIPGPARTEDSDWSTYDPNADPRFGHAVRLMADHFTDCRWPLTTTWEVPPDVRPGQYAARLENSTGVQRDVYFIVRPAAPRAKLACFSTTNTRVAYNFDFFGNTKFDYGCYRRHRFYDMLGQIHGSRRPTSGEPWQRTTVNFELPFYAWLEREGIDFDLYSEWDLEANPDLLDHYEAAAWAGHSEYWTVTQYESLQALVRRGGHVIALSGNTAYWRVSVDLENGVMECRKHARIVAPGVNFDPMLNAAHHHQMDHLPGATMRESGYPEWGLVGNVTNGYTHPPLDGPRSGYTVLDPGHWAFNTPRKLEISDDFAPRAAGYETDLSYRGILERFGPPLAIYPAKTGSTMPPEGFDDGLTILARAKLPGSTLIGLDNDVRTGDMWSEIILWERPGHGLVFSTGSVLSSEVLLTDENFSGLLHNVMSRAGVA